MKTLLIVVLTVLYTTQLTLGAYDDLTKKTKCSCECDDWEVKGECECECKESRTLCGPGYTKVCPEKDGKCSGDTSSPLCPKDIFGMLEPEGRALDNWVHVKEVEDRDDTEDIGEPVRDPRKKERIDDVEVKCKGIPKFNCDFIVDYTVSTVKSFKVSKCNHRKTFEKCPVTIETKDGCSIKAFLYNTQKSVYAKGKMRIECDYTTTPAPTTAGTTAGETAVEMLPPVAPIGDGCTCVPDFAMWMMAAGTTGAEGRQDVTEEPEREFRKRGKVTQEVRCKGVPKFECDFIYDYEACSRINTLSAAKCTHRKDVKKCPIKLVTKDGCEIDTIITNKGAKMIAGKTKISWGDNPLTGFMTRCVCLTDMIDSVSV